MTGRSTLEMSNLLRRRWRNSHDRLFLVKNPRREQASGAIISSMVIPEERKWGRLCRRWPRPGLPAKPIIDWSRVFNILIGAHVRARAFILLLHSICKDGAHTRGKVSEKRRFFPGQREPLDVALVLHSSSLQNHPFPPNLWFFRSLYRDLASPEMRIAFVPSFPRLNRENRSKKATETQFWK